MRRRQQCRSPKTNAILDKDPVEEEKLQVSLIIIIKFERSTEEVNIFLLGDLELE